MFTNSITNSFPVGTTMDVVSVQELVPPVKLQPQLLWKGCLAALSASRKLAPGARLTLGVPLMLTAGRVPTFTVGVPVMPTFQRPLCAALALTVPETGKGVFTTITFDGPGPAALWGGSVSPINSARPANAATTKRPFRSFFAGSPFP